MLEKLLDMDNPTINQELYQIFIDYDGTVIYQYR